MLAETTARDTLVQVMSEAFLKSAVRAVCLGICGVNHPDDQERISNWLRLVLAKCRTVYTKFIIINQVFLTIYIQLLHCS